LSGRTVYAVYVISTAYLSPRGGSWELIYEELKNQWQQAVDYINRLGEAKGINAESVRLEGNPSDKLSRYADEEKMDIIIMGTLGKTELYRMLLGSVAGNLIRHSKVPVMVVREEGEPQD
jgi:nucleotide-binding universal stress UspA family protein